MLNLRLGFTEGTLFFIYFFENIIKNENCRDVCKEFDKTKHNIINWLYSTSGFYDKTIEGDYFNFDYQLCMNSNTYNEYMNRIYLSILV